MSSMIVAKLVKRITSGEEMNLPYQTTDPDLRMK